MGIINILDAQTANLIAAGEVVERPSSAAKELLENAIDAGARNITLEIKNGGRTLLRVTDDGCGFMREDIPKALLRHATSKISCGDDINGIRSLGFRGEALAAIGSVSRLDIISKHRSEEMGTRLTSDENGIVMVDTGCPDGTTVSVRDLFYNTPARQKFLKRDGTEAASCIGAAERLALSHPEISFTVICDGVRRFTTAGDGKLYPAVYAVFGREFAKGLLEVNYDLDGVKVWGFVTPPDQARGSRAMQTGFVNGRYVKSKTLQAALEEAFRSYIPRGKFPGCVLFVSLNPELTDVNVHPAKTEIKFASERDVFRAIFYGVKSALEDEPEDKPLSNTVPLTETKASEIKKETVAESVTEPKIEITPIVKMTAVEEMPQKEASIAKAVNTIDQKVNIVSKTEIPAFESPKSTFGAFKADIGDEDVVSSEPVMVFADSGIVKEEPKEQVVFEQTDIFEKTKENIPENQTTPETASEPATEEQQITLTPQEPVWRMIGQAYDSYIFVETPENILVIDKHAAHERIIYERLASNKELYVQELLAGVAVSLNREQAAILLDNADYLEEKGFKIEDFGEGTVIVRTIPATLNGLKGLGEILEDFAKVLSEGNSLTFEERCDRALYTVACKAALKAGVKNRPEDDENVVKMLSENPSLRYCPHGRPFIKKIPKREIEKYFDR